MFKKILSLIILGFLVACAGQEPQTIVVTQEVEITKIVAGTPVVETVVEERIVEVTPIPEPEEMMEPITLTLWHFGSVGMAWNDGVDVEAWWNRKIDEFTTFNPDIEVEFSVKGREAGGSTLFIDTAVAAGDPPDIYVDVIFREGKYAAQGLLEPVDEALTDEQWARLNPGQVAPLTNADGTHWGVPTWGPPPFVLAINKTLAEAAGAGDLIPTDPDRNWTTDEFEEFLRAVSDPPNRYGALFYAKTPSFTEALVGYAGGFGAKFYTDSDYCNSTINSPEGVAWMDWWLGLIEEGLVVPGAAGLTDDDLDAAFANQQAVVFGGNVGWVAIANSLVESGQVDELEVVLVNYPHAPDQPPPGPAANAGWAFTVFKQDDPKVREAALKFLRYVGSEAFSANYSQGWDVIPAYTDLMSDWAGDDSEKQFLTNSVAANGLQDMGYGVNNFNEVRLLNAEMRQAIFSGSVSAQEGLDNFVEQTSALLCE